jgi:hypothetical protein
MTFEFSKKDIDSLRNDVNYYGEVGKKYLSNSDIGILLRDPKSFRQDRPSTKEMLEGRYFHLLMLEPEKAEDFAQVDASNRNTKIYKEFLMEQKTDFVLLKKEAEVIQELVTTMKSNIRMFEDIYAPSNVYEEPAIKQIGSVMWKGKADIVCEDKLIDIKTTSNINKFDVSAGLYNYDSQAYIYEQLFGKPLVFYVIDKTSHVLGIYRPTEQFLDRGKEKVYQAMEVYRTFYGENPTEDINQYIVEQELF